MGNTCKPMAVSFQCMTKFTTNKKKKKKLGLDYWMKREHKELGFQPQETSQMFQLQPNFQVNAAAWMTAVTSCRSERTLNLAQAIHTRKDNK